MSLAIKQNSGARWWKGIVFRTLSAIALTTLLLGGASNLIIRQLVTDRVQAQAVQGLGELIDSVESTASVACFANDEQLAMEVAQGLLRNSEVQGIVIRSNDKELARIERKERSTSDIAPMFRSLGSPFKKDETIGQIELHAHWDAIYQRAAENGRYATILLTAQLMLVIVGAAGMVFLVVVRPIKAISDRLHRLDATSGKSLRVPEGHEQTELGRLVDDINELTGRLVDTLDQERDLRRRQEIDQRKYQDLFAHTPSGIFVADGDGRLESFNPAFIELTWLPAMAEDSPRLLDHAGWENPAAPIELLRSSLLTHASCSGDFLLRGRRGDERWLHLAITPLGDGSAQGTVTDITLRKREELSARRLAITDSLTGLNNREGLHQAFDQLGQCFALIVINLDGFKQINDAMGFPAGDQILLNTATRIRLLSQPDDFLARIGGDEFVQVMANAQDRSQATARAEALLTELALPYPLEAGPILLGATLGIAFYPNDGADLHQLLRSAELALNGARQARGAATHGYRFFDPSLQTEVEHRRRLEDDLRQAVAAHELRLAFQPIVDIHANKLVGAEALLRWQHAERGFVSPEIFIPLAEKIGLIGEIGRFVLGEACKQVAQWRRNGMDVYVSVNVSARQIPDELPAIAVQTMLRRHKLPPQAIAIEITEGVLMSDIAVAQRWIEELRSAGLRIYLDDFGTGYSSLSYLKRFPMDTVKIDKSFIRDMGADTSDRALVEAIVTMASSLGLNVVAEGVEELAQLALLREMGCTYGQGYLFSRPVAAADFVATATRIDAELALPMPSPSPSVPPAPTFR
ncbi:MAG TPA: EAL domain-containing protein [Rhodocyclaceae bacterium]|nr:EAL domain-containing protein [Rhodocyclaceae bacterium]